VRYYRVYADENGDSHSEEVHVSMVQTDFAPPAPPAGLSRLMPAAALAFLRCPPGWHGPPHPAPRRQFLILLAGQIEGATSDGQVMRYTPGTVFLLEDTWGHGHSTRVVGGDPALLAVVQLPD
jgi:hypothetical protein